MVLFLFSCQITMGLAKNNFRLPSKIHASRALSGNLVNDGILERSRFNLLMMLLSFQEFFLGIITKHAHITKSSHHPSL